MSYRIAKSLATLRDQINALSPNRSKASDGWIGDAAHSARRSDHNPDGSGIVRALDITHDPAHGIDGDKLAAALIASRDPRIKYIIWNRRILSGRAGPQAWVWRPYSGANPHTKHLHLSVVATAAGDDGAAWALDMKVAPGAATAPKATARPLLKRGDRGAVVADLQRMLAIKNDGIFGPATEAAVKAFQTANGLVADGKVGAYTWDALDKAASKAASPSAAPTAPAKPVPAPSPAPKPVSPPAATPEPEGGRGSTIALVIFIAALVALFTFLGLSS
jgi:hypothetical protein